MAIIVKCNEEKLSKVHVKELSYTLSWRDKGPSDKIVTTFQITNDNFPNCTANVKVLPDEEMVAIYKYMKKILEKT